MEHTKSGGLSRFDPRKSLLMACVLGSSLALLVASVLPIWEETHYSYSLLWIPQRVTLWTVAFRLPDERRSIGDWRGRGWPDSLGALVERQRSNLFLAMAVLLAGAFLGGLIHSYGPRAYRQATASRGESGARPKWPVMIVLFLGVAGGALWYQLEKGWTPQKVERMLAAVLRPGSSREQVMSWLESRGLETYVYRSLKRDELDREGNETIVEMSGLDERDLGGLIRGIVYDANVDLILPGQIKVFFFFDKDGRLIKHMVRSWVIMP